MGARLGARFAGEKKRCGPVSDTESTRSGFLVLYFGTREVGGSNPLAPTTSSRSGPDTGVTQRT